MCLSQCGTEGSRLLFFSFSSSFSGEVCVGGGGYVLFLSP